jgi:GNAT superfamily N-acetyltransferase
MLIYRRLTDTEAKQLHEELKTTPNIFGYTINELVRFRDVFIAEAEGRFAGACISKDLHFGWTDIAVLYILPEFRGRGLGSALYTAAWQRAWQRGRHIFTLSCSPEVIHLMERFGMELRPEMWKAPLAVHLHMNRHMMSLYRIKEAIRKSRQMKRTSPLLSGTKRNPAGELERSGQNP